jgi:hypothetical protein
MKSVLSMAVPALLLMSASAFAADQSSAAMQPSGGKSDSQISAGTGGLQGSQTGEGNMNGPNGDGSRGNGGGASNNNMAANSSSSDTMSSPSVSATSELSASTDTSPTYQGGRRAYRGKSERSLNASEAQETAQLNQEQSQFSSK